MTLKELVMKMEGPGTNVIVVKNGEEMEMTPKLMAVRGGETIEEISVLESEMIRVRLTSGTGGIIAALNGTCGCA